jgi:hypothetical protein
MSVSKTRVALCGHRYGARLAQAMVRTSDRIEFVCAAVLHPGNVYGESDPKQADDQELRRSLEFNGSNALTMELIVRSASHEAATNAYVRSRRWNHGNTARWSGFSKLIGWYLKYSRQPLPHIREVIWK